MIKMITIITNKRIVIEIEIVRGTEWVSSIDTSRVRDKKVEREIETEKKKEIRIEKMLGLTLHSGRCMTQEKYTTW